VADKKTFLITFRDLNKVTVKAEELDYGKDGIKLQNPAQGGGIEIVAFVPFEELRSVVEESSKESEK